MDKRFVLFLTVSVMIVVAHSYVMMLVSPPKPLPPPKPAAVAGAQAGQKPEAKAKPEAEAAAKAVEAAKPEPMPAEKAKSEPHAPEELVTLGSLDPASSYRMLVTLTNRGAAVVRAECNDPKLRDLEDRSGYLGHLSLDAGSKAAKGAGDGYKVEILGAGTPAAVAGLKPGDVIVGLNDKPVTGRLGLHQLLERTSPGTQVRLKVRREGQELTLPVQLMRHPLAIIQPENGNPLSFLMTLYQVDDEKLGETEKAKIDTHRELPGVDLRNGTWQIESHDERQVTFTRKLDKWGLEFVKTYRLDTVPAASVSDPSYPAYDLTLDVAVRNRGTEERKVSYQLDGPTGLPKEGYWYASKVNGTLRDVIVSFSGGSPKIVSSDEIANDKQPNPWKGEPVSYIGVDAQYFSVVMMPDKDRAADMWFERTQAIRVGDVDPEWKKTVNTSVRLTSTSKALKPGAAVNNKYTVFAGPKRPELLEHYGLATLVDYGWFDFAAVPMVKILHFFYAIFHNWGIAIIMLTAVVRLCMFPLSKKQALGAMKMQELQPELKRLQEKHKNDAAQRTKAQQELFRKHNYNPLGGCLLVFIQLPIFIALYRSLMVDVELRQAPLLTESIRWCSNLAAPDMLWDWSRFMPDVVVHSAGIFGLGPYFNILPILTIVLFIWQQKKMMPPPADENAAMQQKVMKYMMVFMGVLFYKVAAGLCLYFIASSLWGMGERMFLPKLSHGEAQASGGGRGPAPPRPGTDGSGPRGKKAKR